ncbi:hypothetical protein [Mesorhizobium sp. M1406]|uniref:hypothetical protein n=1 Tax=Mesorhizobium sp. M1406 TaxID=2957099 RepID=UPI00333A7457
MVDIPVYCPNCGNLFASRAISIRGDVRNLVLEGNTESCPRCGRMASIIEGKFDVVDGVLQMLKGSQLSTAMLKQFVSVLKQAQRDEISTDDLIARTQEINPDLGKAIAPLRGRKKSAIAVTVMIIIAALQSCNFNLSASVDLNQLVDQAVEILETTEQPMLPGAAPIPTSRPSDHDGVGQESRQVRRQNERRAAKAQAPRSSR